MNVQIRSAPDKKTWSNGYMTIGLIGPVITKENSARSLHDCIGLEDTDSTIHGSYGGNKAKRILFRGGDFSITPAGTEYYSLSEKRDLRMFVDFKSEFRHRFIEEMKPSVRLDEPRMATSGLLNGPAHRAMIKDFVRSDGFGGTLRAESILTLLLCDLCRTLEHEYENKVSLSLNEKKLKKVIEYIDLHLDEKISIRSLAELVHISPFHFARVFKETTGLPPHQFVIRLRVTKAKKLLRDPSISLAEVAYRVGFSSQSHLCTAFRKVFDVTPGKFRKDVIF